jgi:superfamily II DNA or RNA helicase
MARSIRLRRWQKDALERFAASPANDFLAVATPGAGKTTFALTAARKELAGDPRRRLIVVVPTQHLKVQWARAAAGFDLHLEPTWAAADGRLPSDMHGVAVTYQQVATSAEALRALSSGAFVIFDEIHHAGDERAWGDAIRLAFEPAGRRLALSGTPFRSDTQSIPFVNYYDEEARPDYEYGYGNALVDGGVVRPVYFPRINGHMEWSAPDGGMYAHTFEDPLSRVHSGQRLRTALSLEGEWLPDVLRQANEQLMALRAVDPAAAGLVIAMDQDHARGIADMLARRFKVRAEVATSDDPTASGRIARFADGTDPWIVAVRMVSEGVDIPRLRVGVFATNTTTELFFRQAVGRLLRWTRGSRRQKAFMFIPDDPRLRALAFQIADQRRHSLRKRADKRDDAILDPRPEVEAPFDEIPNGDEQLSLFAAISAVAIGDPHRAEIAAGDDEPDVDLWEPDDDSLVVELEPAPVLGSGGTGTAVGTLTRREHKGRLRDLNAERVRFLVRITGWSHAQVNAELNRLSGVRRVTEATVEQLERRLKHADRWLDRL